MPPINDRPVRVLMREMIQLLQITPTQVLTKQEIIAWFQERYSNIRQGTVEAHLTRMSVNAPSRLHHNLRIDGSDNLFYKIDSNHFRLYDSQYDPTPIADTNEVRGFSSPPDTDALSDESPAISSAFAYENDLRDYLAKNLTLIEPGLTLYQAQDMKGVEYPAGGRFIDILAIDSEGGFVIIELKVSKGYDRTVGQLLRYIGWIEKYQAEPDQKVRGVIIAKTISEDLKLACERLSFVNLIEYNLSVSLNPIV